MKTLLLLLVFSFFSVVAIAAPEEKPDEAVVKEMARQINMPEEEIRQNFNACDSGHTVKMIICGRYHWVAEDMRLNRIYKHALADAREIGYEASLVKAQRAWLAYRDALCKYEGEWGAGGGREEGIYRLSCMEEVTRQRAEYLKARLSPDTE